MSFRLGEVWSVLAAVIVLIAAKHVPSLSGMPLTQITGILCFAFAIYLSLGIRNELIAEASGR